jgi:hypothetical protein
MVLKKKNKIIHIILLIVLLFSIFVFALNIVKGPTINVVNCNGDVITNSQVCYNSSYYYLGDDNLIYSVTDENNINIFYDQSEFKYITCNTNYIFAADKESIFQFDTNGKVLNSISRDTNDCIFSLIDGIFATDDCVFCRIGSAYLLLDPVTLDTISIKDLIGYSEWRDFGDVKVATNNGIKMISTLQSIELDSCTFLGSIIINDEQLINLCYNNVVGGKGTFYIEYNAYNGTIFKNINNGNEYNTPKTDIRHFFITEDLLISFNSLYDQKSILKKLCILSDNYSIRDYGLYNNYPLIFHKYDQINITSLITGKVKTINTKKLEKIIYIDKSKAITYYKGNYMFYNLDNWNCYKKISSNEIKQNRTYTFESCKDNIFVFDSSNKLIDIINISEDS